MLKAFIRNNFSLKNKKKIHNLLQDIRAIGSGRNLNKLANIYKTDKNLPGGHFYTPNYSHHLKKYRYKRFNMLEIGIGGYDNPYLGGNSLRMWKKYFPFGRIHGLDIFDKFFHEERRVKIFQGSQVDTVFLDSVVKEIGGIDVIIDDGSHMNEHVIESFNYLFPKLKDGGVYIVEDVQTSYWEDFGGDSVNLDNKQTMMGYFKSLTDKLNKEEIILPNYIQDYFDKKIISIHFYYNMIFIYKGDNNEKSNTVINNQRIKN